MSKPESNPFKQLEEENIKKFGFQDVGSKLEAFWNRVNNIRNDLDMLETYSKKLGRKSAEYQRDYFINDFAFSSFIFSLIKVSFVHIPDDFNPESFIENIKILIGRKIEINLYRINYSESNILLSVCKEEASAINAVFNPKFFNNWQISTIEYLDLSGSNDNSVNPSILNLKETVFLLKKDIKEKIAEGKIDEAFLLFEEKIKPESNIYDDLIILKSFYNRLKKSSLNFELSFEDYQLFLNKIAISILSFLPRITSGHLIIA